MSERFRCAPVSAARSELLLATASNVRRWLMVEQPGPWGRDALRESRLPAATAAALVRLGQELAARVILIRRHGRAQEGPVTAYAAATYPGHSHVESFALERPSDLLDLDLSALRHGRRCGGEGVDSLYLVCTNGRHDACCAEFGRPLAAALSAALGDAVWECSHIGGDRFAANLVCFPHGVYYGRLSPQDATTVAALHEEGLIDLDRYRGRSALPFVAQAAEHLIRRERGLDRLDELRWRGLARIEDAIDDWQVGFSTRAGSRVTATIRRRPDPVATQLTCQASELHHPPRYELLSLTDG
ncbi:MAG: sucrase ferredoxin [Egibacteraceae bacterium]